MNARTAAVLILVLSALSACSAEAPPAAPAAVTSAAAAPGSAPPSSAAPPAAKKAPSRAFTVKTVKLKLSNGKDRPLPTTVWYPTGDGPFPLVLFSHGLTSEPAAYVSVLEEWAKAGFVVAAPAYPHTSYGVKDLDPVDIINQPGDATKVITEVLARNDTSGDVLAGKIDPARIGAAGHSAGGITTVGLFSGSRDDRLIAGVVLAGRQVLPVPFYGTPAPMLFVHGKLDKTVPFADGQKAYDAVPWPKALMSVTQGGHVAITKDFGPVINTTTDFLRYALYGDDKAKDRLTADATKGGRATLDDRL